MVAADAARVRELWSNPELVSAGDVPMLEELVADYPAAVPLWWLYLRAVQRADAPQFAQILQRCASLSPNRAALMAWVEAPLLPVSTAQGARDAVVAQAVEVPKPAEVPKPVEAPKIAEQPKPASALAVPVPPAVPAVPRPAPPAAEPNLDSLPEKVREQILRARALKAKISGVAAPASAPAPIHGSATALTSVPSPQAAEPPVVAPKPAKPKVRAAAATERPVSPPAQTSPDRITPPAAQVAPASESDLSPFAQFVAQLADQSADRPTSSDLIDQFLTANPRISPVAKDAPPIDVRTQPDAQVTGLVTETLARMYAEQGHVAKAIQAYEILKLRVPEKSPIFAARIEALRNS